MILAFTLSVSALAIPDPNTITPEQLNNAVQSFLAEQGGKWLSRFSDNVIHGVPWLRHLHRAVQSILKMDAVKDKTQHLTEILGELSTPQSEVSLNVEHAEGNNDGVHTVKVSQEMHTETKKEDQDLINIAKKEIRDIHDAMRGKGNLKHVFDSLGFKVRPE